MNQADYILRYLQDEGTITPVDALREFGCFRLGARISELRGMGHHIVTQWETGKNRYGHTTRYARYKLEE